MGRLRAPEQSFAEAMPSTIISQLGCILSNASLAFSAAGAQVDHGQYIPCGSFRKSAPSISSELW
jgi:hypothetical protein